MSCGVGHRCDLDLMLLWLWRRLATGAPIEPLAWKPPCAAGAALLKKKSDMKISLISFFFCLFVVVVVAIFLATPAAY